MYYNLFDSHAHSEHSPDGGHSISFMAETAISKGLQGLAITDHFEADSIEQWSYGKRIMQSEVSTRMAKAAFNKPFILTFGVEIAQVFYDVKAVEALLNRHNFDFVIGSVHRLFYEGFDYYENRDYTQISPDKLHEYNIKYYEEMLDLIKWGKFDILAHLSFPVRYPKIYSGIDVDLTRYREHIDEVLRLAVANGKGIEINTSGLRNEIGDTMPPMWILKRFKELGGEIVTIGSDAHNADDLGAGIEVAMQMMADAGYGYFAFYRGRNPVMLRII